MAESGTYKIRPAGRHILTIGRDLIQDPHAAVIELVKNAYDADSPDVAIAFECNTDGKFQITVADRGHGMSRDTVINRWMVPSTSDKQDRGGMSPGGRTMQGRKGIGRYAASILGNDLLLETTTSSGEKTVLYVQWKDFDDAEYLDDVDVLIQTEPTDDLAGTTLTIAVDEEHLIAWKGPQFHQLQFELRKLVPPFGSLASRQGFDIVLRICDFPEVDDTDSIVEPYPLVEHFDYRISGTVDAKGKASLVYTQQKARNVAPEEISMELEDATDCGQLEIDVRVYDRDAESIDRLIRRGLKDDSGNYLGKLQARQLLNEYNGIGVYRNGFRLRPLGDPEFDWLKLNEQRIQRPAFRIGNNQVIGYVQIESEEQSNLIEKSARDGLIENEPFRNLKKIMRKVIFLLEEKRYLYRRKAGLSSQTLKVEHELERLYSFDALKRQVRNKLSEARVNKTTTSAVIALIETDENRRSGSVETLRNAIAMYQGHATLGKIINVVLHEGRRPLNYFRNQIPLLRRYSDAFAETKDPYLGRKVVEVGGGIADNASDFVSLFSRLDPLAAQRRSGRKLNKLAAMIRQASDTFMLQIRERNVTCEISGDHAFELECWRQDIQAIFTNLIDNSLYWFDATNSEERRIDIKIYTEDGRLLHVDYLDTGPGIEPDHIDSEAIFDPQFSTKLEGTGLGLAIAGEAATRNGLELTARDADYGAWFRLEPTTGEKA